MRRKGPTIYRGKITTAKKGGFWKRLLLFIIIVVILILGLSTQKLLDQFFPAPGIKSTIIDRFDTHCLGDAPPDVYQLSGLIVTLSQSNFPVISVSTTAPDTANNLVEQTIEAAIRPNPGEMPTQVDTSTVAQKVTETPTIKQTSEQEIVAQKTQQKESAKGWIMQQQPGYFTLQIIGSRNRDALNEIATRHLKREPHAIYERTLKGRPWYSLIVGNYPTLGAAIRARKKLPRGLSADKAWPRKFSDIHKQIKQD